MLKEVADLVDQVLRQLRVGRDAIVECVNFLVRNCNDLFIAAFFGINLKPCEEDAKREQEREREREKCMGEK